MDAATGRWRDFAPAKINLTLHIGPRRPDGYHELESLVVFAGAGDDLTFTPDAPLALSIDGETAADAGDVSENLVLKAARALHANVPALRLGHFHLTKRLPVAAGIGGGSSDAAAALRLLARANDLALGDARLIAAARATGADVPVCLDPRPRVMRGIGELLSSPLPLPALHAVLVNPRLPVPTGQVFAALAKARASRAPVSDCDPAARWLETTAAPAVDDLLSVLAQSRNDLEAPALAICPAIGEVLAALRGSGDCRLARMSGSGGTCFGLFSNEATAHDAARTIQANQPYWWVHATQLGAAPGY